MDNLTRIKARMEVYKERLEVLDEQIDLWEATCKPCTLIYEAIKRGELSPSTCKDKTNAICETCPTQPKFTNIGEKLSDLMSRDRLLRKR